MKGRAALFAGAVAILLFALLAAWMLAPQKQPPSDTQQARLEDQAKDVVNAKSATAAPSREDAQLLQQQERTKAVFKAIEGTNVPINFWGKVVDQNERSIAGVAVRYSYSTEHGNLLGVAWGAQKIHKGEVTTDATGLFAVNGIKGHILTIETLMKEGFNYTSKGAKVFNYYGSTASGKFIPKPANPVLFVMVNKATAEPLVSYGGDFGKTMRLPGDGSPVRWSVSKGHADPNGELQVTLKREPAVLARVGRPVTWSVKVGVVGGGIVEASQDEPIRRAPEEGYVSTLDYPHAEQKRGVPARSFYIKTADGMYGRIELYLYPNDDGPTARCLIKSSLNPNGSRNFER